MKRLPRTRVLILSTAAIVMILFLCQGCGIMPIPIFSNLNQGFFGLILKERQKIKLETTEEFEKVLNEVTHEGVSYHFDFIPTPGATPKIYSYGPDVVIQTDKVLITKLAKQAHGDGNQTQRSSLSHKIFSTNSRDIEKIAGIIEQPPPAPPTPTPTPTPIP